MSSSSPGRPRSLKRLSQKRTVAPHRPILAAIPGALRPSTACWMICARRTSPAPSFCERVIRASLGASSSLNPRTRRVIAQQLAEEALGRAGIASALHQDIGHTPFLIDRAPKVMQLAPDANKDLIHVPFITGPGTAPLELVGEQPAETQAPLADALVTDHDAAGGQDQLDITQA